MLMLFLALPIACLALWSFAALWFDARPALAWLFLAIICASVFFTGSSNLRWAIPLAISAAVIAWWLTLEPIQTRAWATEYSRLPTAEIDGDRVTLHNVRCFSYLPGKPPVPHWETRTYDLSEVEGLDLALNYWGSPWIAHPILIFRFKNSPPLAFSIETRRQAGEKYSALAGFFRKYGLIVLAGDERDMLGVRANHRKGEDIYLYATGTTKERARAQLLEYLDTINNLEKRPRWYNALTANCTTTIRSMNRGPKIPFDWRLIINGKADEMLHELGLLRSDGLAFSELKQRAHANQAVREACDAPDFSAKIRAGRPGFGPES